MCNIQGLIEDANEREREEEGIRDESVYLLTYAFKCRQRTI